MTNTFYTLYSPAKPLDIGTLMFFAGMQTKEKLIRGVIIASNRTKGGLYDGGVFYSVHLDNGENIEMSPMRMVL